MRLHPTLLTLGLLSCHASSPSQAPIRLWVAHPKAEVIRLTSVAVTSAGFTVTKSDTVAGSLAAERAAAAGGNAPFQRCEQGQGGPRAPVAFSSRVTLVVAVQDTSGGALVGISAEVPSARTEMAGPGGHPVLWTCRSSGRIEQVVAESLQ